MRNSSSAAAFSALDRFAGFVAGLRDGLDVVDAREVISFPIPLVAVTCSFFSRLSAG